MATLRARVVVGWDRGTPAEPGQPLASIAVVLSESFAAQQAVDGQGTLGPGPPEAPATITVPPEPPLKDRPWLRWVDRLVIALCVLGGVMLRFVASTPLWLDEALSVNIAKLPISQIPDALRHDGHPPLYYVLLHAWMKFFGNGDIAVRSLSGIFAVALLPLMWVAGNRLGGRRTAWLALAVAAICPFTIRYGTETRMYSLVMLLALAAWLVLQDALRKPTLGRLAALSTLVAALLYTHYWAMWLLGAGAAGVLWELRKSKRAGQPEAHRAQLRVLLSLVVGGVLFLPWVPILLYQGSHTGTPWGQRVLPSGVIAYTLADIGGGPAAEAVVFGGACAVLMMVAVFCRPLSRRFLEVDLWTLPDSRPLLFTFAGTMTLAMLFGYATSSTFVTRYTSVVFPFFVLLVALGISRFQWPMIARAVIAVLLVLGTVGAVRTSYVDQRTEARAGAQQLLKTAQPHDVIAYCPDQLGPSMARELAGHGPFDQVTYPKFHRPERVDWVDYAKVLEQASPQAFAQQLNARAGNRRIYVVWSDGYQRTHHKACSTVIDALSLLRPIHFELLAPRGDKYYEPSTVWLFPVPPKP